MATTTNPRRAVTRDEVLAIRKMYDSGFTIEVIAKRHRRHRDTIADICLRRTHKRVKELKKLPPLPGWVQDLDYQEEERRLAKVEEWKAAAAARSTEGAKAGVEKRIDGPAAPPTRPPARPPQRRSPF